MCSLLHYIGVNQCNVLNPPFRHYECQHFEDLHILNIAFSDHRAVELSTSYCFTYLYGRKSADRTEHENDVIFFVFLATIDDQVVRCVVANPHDDILKPCSWVGCAKQ